MTLLSAENISKRYDDQVILEGVSFTLKNSSRIGLVGRNGIGKTTLFELLVDRRAVDSGSITTSRSCLIDYVKQEKDEYLDDSLFDHVASAREDLLTARREIGELESRLALNPDDKTAVERLGELHHRFEVEGGFSFENEVKSILQGLGFEPQRHRERLRNFSGGEKNRAALARALAGKGNLLLLDEPTNHLDIESTRWLEEYLEASGRAYIVVSHDRAFLSAVAEEIWEMCFGRIDVYHGGFERFLVEREERRRLQEHRFKHQQAEVKRIEEFVRRNIAGQKTKQAQSKLKYLGRIKRLEAPREDVRRQAIRMQSSGRSYAHVLQVSDVTLGYGDHVVIENLSFDVYRGYRIGLIGRNGSGKSTILKALIGELAAASGDIKLGANVDVAYFDQELSDLDPNVSVLDSLWELDPVAPVERIRSFLARYGFIDQDPLKPVAALSGGEKTKLSLARLLYHPANFIIFDEPTNHLDMDSRETLEKALSSFDGSCLVVSHDRYFLDQVVNQILHLADGRAKMYPGDYSYFREKTEEPAPAEKKRVIHKAPDSGYLEFKEQSRRKGRHKKDLQRTREEIARLESMLEQLEADIRDTIPESDWQKLNDASERKARLEDELLRAYAHLERLKEGRG